MLECQIMSVTADLQLGWGETQNTFHITQLTPGSTCLSRMDTAALVEVLLRNTGILSNCPVDSENT